MIMVGGIHHREHKKTKSTKEEVYLVPFVLL
jgi:hypothetical protein